MSIALRTVARDAKLHHRFTTRSGKLERAVRYEVGQSGLEGRAFLDKGVAPYAAPVHEGSKPHVIKAITRKALYFVKAGRGVMVPLHPHKVPGWMVRSGFVGNGKTSNITWSQKGYVDHPGTKPDKFLFQAFDRQRQTYRTLLRDSVMRAFKIAGV
jgi:hypothetical protein